MVEEKHKFTQVGIPAILISTPFLARAFVGLFLGASSNTAVISFGIIALVALTFFVFYCKFTINVSKSAVEWHFGFGLYNKHIAIKDITRVEIVEDTGVWRFGILETSRGMLFNVAGHEAIRIYLKDSDGEEAIVELGTYQPERLSEIIGSYLLLRSMQS